MDNMTSLSWIQLTYKVPPEPARKRIGLWRKIKAMGAVYLQNGVCLLPKTDDHLRRLKMLENEIAEMDGEAVLLETVGLDRVQEEKVVVRFNAERDEQYREFLERCAGFRAEIERESAANKFTYAELEENDGDLQKLRTWLGKIKALDFYGSPLGSEAETALINCWTILDDFAQQVFAAQAENRLPPNGTAR
jgi:hypothetical protein